MTHDKVFKQWAIKQGLNVDSNFQSNFYSSRATRIAYYDMMWAAEKGIPL